MSSRLRSSSSCCRELLARLRRRRLVGGVVGSVFLGLVARGFVFGGFGRAHGRSASRVSEPWRSFERCSTIVNRPETDRPGASRRSCDRRSTATGCRSRCSRITCTASRSPCRARAAREYEPFERRAAVGRRLGHHVVPDARRDPGRIGRDRRSSRCIDLGGADMVGFTAEGLIWDGDQPRPGTAPEAPRVRGRAVSRRRRAVELLIEAAANPIPPWTTTPWPLLMPDVDGPPIYRLGQAELAVVHRDVEALVLRHARAARSCSTCSSGTTLAAACAASCRSTRSSRRATRSRADDVAAACARSTSTTSRCRAAALRWRRARPGDGRAPRERGRARAHRLARGCGRSARRSASARARSPTRCA